MYLDHFGLRQPPFKITPNTEFFYAGGNRGAILDALLYAVANGEGIIKVTGEIGSGKTMLCRMLGNLLPENVDAIVLVNPSLSRDEILYTVAEELGLDMAGQRISQVIRELQHHLIERHEQGHQVVAFLDEAQAMPLDSLEEIRLLSNLETAHHKLLQIVLFGQPELNESLGLPRMRQLKERITHSFVIPPLSRKEIPEYLMFRMRAAGYRGPEIFDEDAIRLIDDASKGITRRINILADKALLAAFSENTHHIRAKQMKAAIGDCDFHVATPFRPPLKKVGFAIMLALLGAAFVVGWQHHTNAPPPARTAPAQIVRPAPQPAAKAVQSPVAQAQAAPAAAGPVLPVQTTNKVPPPSEAKPSLYEKPAINAPLPATEKNSAQATRATSPAQQGKLVLADPARAAATSTNGKAKNHPEDATAPTPFQQQLDATRAWLANGNSHYTIQLMVLTEPHTPPKIMQILDNVKKEIGSQDIYIYPFKPSSTGKYQVRFIFGSFSSRDQAIAAIAKLPANYKASRPFRRTTKGIMDEIEQQVH